MKNRKNIYIAVGIVLLLVLVAGAIIVLVQKDNKKTTTDDTAQIVDKNKHIGVAGVVTQKMVTDSFKGLAGDVSGPTQSGTLVAEPELEGETARYTLKTDKNGKSVYVDVNVLAFINKDELNKTNPFAGTSEEVISGVGDEARYFTPRATAADEQTAVIVVKDATSYKFSLMQNKNDGIDITQTAAKKALLELAKQANYSIKK